MKSGDDIAEDAVGTMIAALAMAMTFTRLVRAKKPGDALAVEHHQVGADETREQRAISRVEILVLDSEPVDPRLHVRQVEKRRDEAVPVDHDRSDDARRSSIKCPIRAWASRRA